MGRRVDAHHHLWDLDVRDQPWTAEFPPLRRSFRMSDLQPLLAAEDVDGTVLVEAAGTLEETEELLALADDEPAVLGVVGWVDLQAPDVGDQVARLRDRPGGHLLVGARHGVQNEPDPQWLARPQVRAGLRRLGEDGLVVDLVVRSHQLPAVVDAVRATPGTRFVLDHLGKPPVDREGLDPWRAHVAALAGLPNVAAKLSGLVTEVAGPWSAAQLQPYADHAVAHFGPDRVMVGSDWPVCLLQADYATVTHLHEQLVRHLDPAEKDAVLGGTATTWYGLR